eukprot:3160531-Rhodomonas_salina.1
MGEWVGRREGRREQGSVDSSRHVSSVERELGERRCSKRAGTKQNGGCGVVGRKNEVYAEHTTTARKQIDGRWESETKLLMGGSTKLLSDEELG